MDVPVYNMQGAQVATVKIDEKSLGGEVNPSLLKQAFVMYHANLRQGSARTRNRHEVEGSTRKLYKQKGTGNARHGDRKVNIFRGGGHGHSKKRTREDFRQAMPKKMRRKANRNALLAKLVDQQVRVVDSIAFDAPRTRAFQDFLTAIKADHSTVVALPMDEGKAQNARLSGRNIDGVRLIRVDQLNTYEMLNNRYLVIGRPELESWLKGPSSQTDKSAKIAPLGRVATPAASAAAAAPAPAAAAKKPARKSTKKGDEGVKP
ncbi:MAG: 50S ribosomal protein L4 [Phycisphaerae bacterium]|nr:MAG: 50S ribosomal protein L4 [Phycisphaerae bacterium]